MKRGLGSSNLLDDDLHDFKIRNFWILERARTQVNYLHCYWPLIDLNLRAIASIQWFQFIGINSALVNVISGPNVVVLKRSWDLFHSSALLRLFGNTTITMNMAA